MIDVIDAKIIQMLQEDGSLSIAQLADRLGMTPPPCWRRVKALKDRGVLTRQVWQVNPQSVSLDVAIYATVRLSAHDASATSAFREEIRNLPEITECYILLGGIDVLLRIVVPSISYYESFFYERLSQLPAVREVTSSVVMSEIKRTMALPIDIGRAAAAGSIG